MYPVPYHGGGGGKRPQCKRPDSVSQFQTSDLHLVTLDATRVGGAPTVRCIKWRLQRRRHHRLARTMPTRQQDSLYRSMPIISAVAKAA